MSPAATQAGIFSGRSAGRGSSGSRQSPAAPAGFAEGGAVILVAAAIFICAHLAAFTNPFVINDDVRQQIFWMQQWQDPELFQDDLLTDYARHYVPWGVKALYRLASVFIGPLLFSKILTGTLFVLLSLCLYLIGTELLDRRLAWITVAVFWLMPFFLDRISGGLARSFAFPLLAWFWLAWLRREPWGMGGALLAQSLFIPYLAPLAAGAALLAWGRNRLSRSSPPPFPAHLGHFACLALALGLVALFNYHLTAGGFGPLVSKADMANRPEFTAQGRFPLVPVASVFWELVQPWEFIAPFREWGPLAGALVCGALVILVLFGWRRLAWQELFPRLQPVMYLGLASLACYAAARLFLLKLFVPDRYVIYTLNLFYCLALALGFYGLSRDWRLTRGAALGLLAVVAGLSCWRLHGVGLYDYSEFQPLAAVLSQTPKEALIAGHPELADNIPAFARRRAFVTLELAHPWSTGYWQKIRPRLEEFFAAYYAADPQAIRAFCRKHRISHLVVDPRHFTPEFLAGKPFFAPFDAYIRGLAQPGRPFAALSRNAFPAQEISESLRLLDMGPTPPQLSPKALFQGTP